MMDKIVSKSLLVDVAFKHAQEVFRVAGACDNCAGYNNWVPESIFALAPEGTDSVRLLDFLHGGILEPLPKISDGLTAVQRVPSTVVIAAEIVCQHLALCEHPTLWLHEALLTKEELKAKNLPNVTIDGTIYLVFSDGLDVSRVTELIQYSLLSWHFLGFVLDGTNNSGSVAELISAAKFVLIGAYDGESFLYLNGPRSD
ncbi:hypothetical protein PO883_34345 [Massilia sp. DJPM01]|uniref:hypothetical protein n=1 Tax=Massilia sp. DJPM01 TaxID=3024404 RepID=UPI00259DF80E|nr:hypothetical protein [Massilia sp. DJPM01]MDM5182250.1 hypothetical protein [Massilia sp. DJPM01]